MLSFVLTAVAAAPADIVHGNEPSAEDNDDDVRVSRDDQGCLRVLMLLRSVDALLSGEGFTIPVVDDIDSAIDVCVCCFCWCTNAAGKSKIVAMNMIKAMWNKCTFSCKI